MSPTEPAQIAEPPTRAEAAPAPSEQREVLCSDVEELLGQWATHRTDASERGRHIRESVVAAFHEWDRATRSLLETIRTGEGPLSSAAREVLVLMCKPQSQRKSSGGVSGAGKVATAMRQIVAGAPPTIDLVEWLRKEFGHARDAMTNLDDRRAANLFLVRMENSVGQSNPAARAGSLMQLVATLTEKPAYALCAALAALAAASLYRTNIATVIRAKAPKLAAHADGAVAMATRLLMGIDLTRAGEIILYTPEFAAVIHEIRGMRLPDPDGTGTDGRGAPAGGQTPSAAGSPVPASGTPSGMLTQTAATALPFANGASILVRACGR